MKKAEGQNGVFKGGHEEGQPPSTDRKRARRYKALLGSGHLRFSLSARLAPRVTIQPAASPLFQEISLDLLPRQNAGRIFTIPPFTIIQLSTLFCAEGRQIRFQAFPKCIQPLEFFRCGGAFKVLRQMAHTLVHFTGRGSNRSCVYEFFARRALSSSARYW